MNICSIYGFNAFPPKGGNHLHALQLIRQFQRAGHTVSTWGDGTVPGVKAYPRTEQGMRAMEKAADVLYVRVDGRKMGDDPLLVSLLKSTDKPTVWEINSPANEALAYSYLGGTRRKGTGAWRLVDRVRRELHARRQIPGIKVEDALRKELARGCYGAICVSDGVGTYAAEALQIRRVEVVPNGADPDEQRPEGDVATLPPDFADKLVVLYAGSPMYPWQGLDVLEETMRLCDREGDPIRFVLLLNQQGPRAISSPNALVLHAVPHREVGNYLRAVDAGVYIHPPFFWSEWGNHMSPMKMFEYMAFGCPVIASNVGQIAQVVTHGRNGFLFDNSATGLRTTLLRAFKERARLREMGREARMDIERTYNWGAVAQRTLGMLHAAVADQTSRRNG